MTAQLNDSDLVSNSTPAQIDVNLDETFDEFAEYDNLSTEFKRVFPKLLDCVAHSLQLPLKMVIDNNRELSAVRAAVLGLLGKFNKAKKQRVHLNRKAVKN